MHLRSARRRPSSRRRFSLRPGGPNRFPPRPCKAAMQSSQLQHSAARPISASLAITPPPRSPRQMKRRRPSSPTALFLCPHHSRVPPLLPSNDASLPGDRSLALLRPTLALLSVTALQGSYAVG